MTEPKLQLAHLDDPRLAALALSPMPVWLWSAGADRILWANPVAAAIFAAASPAEITVLRFDARHTYAVQIARLASTLAEGGAPRLERLRGFGSSIGGTLICLCSRIVLADGNPAILSVSTERAGKELALPERAHRLLHDVQLPSAIFTADGELIEAQTTARERMGARCDLLQLGAEEIAREACAKGAARGQIEAGQISIIKLGAGPTFALLVTFADSSDIGAKRPEQKEIAPSGAAELNASPHRMPLRFVWETDAETRITLFDQEFAGLIGPNAAAVAGRNWDEAARTIDLDPGALIANALKARETFSGINIRWPIDGSDQRLTVEMSGLPIYDRERRFKGFRGFGICRDIDKINELKDIRSRQKSRPPAAGEIAPKVLTFPAPTPPPAAGPSLNAREHSAFQELARELSQRLKKPQTKGEPATPQEPIVEPVAPPPQPSRPAAKPGRDALENRTILDRLPVGILVYRLNSLIYANRAFLDWTGYATLDELAEAGGLDSLFIESKDDPSSKSKRNGAKSLTIATVNGKQRPVDGRLFSVTWNGENALALVVETKPDGGDKEARSVPPGLLKETHELKAILDTATDGVLVLDRAGRVLSANRSAQALFGYEAGDFIELSITDLLVPESHRSVLDHLGRLAHGDGVGALHAGYEAIGRVRQGGLVPLHITIGRIEDGEKLCAVLRDITDWKRTEEELVDARQAAEKASMAKSEFLAKISHEIRTPLNAIIGFSEVMMDERFGPIGNDRYRQYLKDIHASGGHLISLLNDLLDLSKIEAGKLELTFVSVNLNDLVQQCVAIMQQQANRERVIVRTSLPGNLPQVIADARSVRQIALNLLSNSIKFTGAGGQIIISTTQTDAQEVVLRVRDTGTGMSEKELQTALEPFRQVAPAAFWGSSGTGLGLPITKALAEANHARFHISSQVDDGTLAEVVFPASRVLAQ